MRNEKKHEDTNHNKLKYKNKRKEINRKSTFKKLMMVIHKWPTNKLVATNTLKTKVVFGGVGKQQSAGESYLIIFALNLY